MGAVLAELRYPGQTIPPRHPPLAHLTGAQTLKPKPPATWRTTSKRTQLRRASAQAARRLAKEAAEREWRAFLTAKFDRTWKAMTGFAQRSGRHASAS